MNYANKEQLKAVGHSCNYYDSKEMNFINNVNPVDNISCGTCTNWDGQKCKINVFDDILTSLDQT